MSQIVKNIFRIFTGTSISRVFGFFRDMVVAKYFGTGIVADAFSLALIFPNMMRQILGEDMVERAFMPPFKTIYDKGEQKRAWDFLSVVFNWFFVILLGFTALFYLLIPLFFSLRDTFPGVFGFILSSKQFDFDLTLELILVMLPFMLFIGLAAFIGSLLNFFDKNWIFAFAPVMLSVGVIVSIVLFEPAIGGYSIALGYVLGAFLQFLIQLIYAGRKSFRKETGAKYRFRFKDSSPEVGVIKRESGIITLNALCTKSGEVFTRFLATSLFSGAISSLSYAQRLFQLPFAIISLSISRGINPTLNKMKSNEDRGSFNELLNKGIRLNLLLIIPVTVIIFSAAEEIVRLAFMRGAFNEKSLILTSQALMMYSLGILPLSLVSYYTKVLSLFSKNRYALKISFAGAVLNIVFAYLFAYTLGIGHEGIALASSLAFFINMILMRRYLKRELGSGSMGIRFKLAALVQIAAGAGVVILLRSLMNMPETTLMTLINLVIKSGITGIIFGSLFLIEKRVLKW